MGLCFFSTDEPWFEVEFRVNSLCVVNHTTIATVVFATGVDALIDWLPEPAGRIGTDYDLHWLPFANSYHASSMDMYFDRQYIEQNGNPSPIIRMTILVRQIVHCMEGEPFS